MVRPCLTVCWLAVGLAACRDKPTDPTEPAVESDADTDADADADADADTEPTPPDSASDSGTTLCPDGFYSGPTTIQEVSVACNGGVVRFYARTEGWTDEGRVFSQETSNGPVQWSDEHTLQSYQFDSCGFEDELERMLTVRATLDDWQTDVSTLFSCQYHYNDGLVMTYAFQVDDLDGNFADCIVAGADRQGMVNGDHTRVNEPSFDLTQCRQGTLAQ